MAKTTSRVIRQALTVLAAILVVLGFTTANASAANMIDVSSWQTGINVTTTGSEVNVAKATEGTNYVNRDCDRVVQQSLSAGKGAGVYHFAHTYNSPEAEADFFLNNTKGYVGKGIVPILDWEPEAPGSVWWAQRWLNRVEQGWGAKPIIYMNQSTENSYNWSSVVQQNYGLWIAAYPLGYTPIYGFNPPAQQPTLRSWPWAVAWQYTSTGRVNGWNGNLDLSVIYGSVDTWRAYAGGSTGGSYVPPAPSPAPVEQNTGSCVVVGYGDSLSAIASRLGVGWQSLTGYRSGNPNLIYPGESVCTGGAVQQQATGHVVVRGESLWAIYGTGWSAAAARNGISAPYIIYPGQVLR